MRLYIFTLLFIMISWVSYAQTGNRTAAYEFNKKLGRGMNFMGSKINGGFHHPYDFELLRKNHFTHIRIGSRLWDNVGPAPNYTIDAAKLASYKNAVDWALNENLLVIVDPIHAWDTYNDADSTKLYKLWEQLATTFASYPKDKVAFEIINEPRNNNLNLKNMIKACLSRIRAVAGNQERIVIVSGQGFPTRVALINAFNNNTFPANDDYLIGTFHFYDPKPFTKQGHFNNGVVNWADNGDNDPEWNDVPTKFQEVQTADSSWAVSHNTDPIPIYNGEYGVDNAAPQIDRARWLWWVRTISEKMGFSNAIWNMYGSSPSSKGIGPWTTLEKNNPTSRTLNQKILIPYHSRYESENAHSSTGNFSPENYNYSSGFLVLKSLGGSAGDIVIYDSINIFKSGNYDLTLRYINNGSQNVSLMLISLNSNNQLLDSIELVLPPSTTSWNKITVNLPFQTGVNNKLHYRLTSSAQSFSMDYFAITYGAYYDNHFPAESVFLNIEDSYLGKTENISIFPNPAKDIVKIKGNFNKWELLSLNGQLIKSGNTKTINVQNSPAGLYFLKVDNKVIKLMIQ